MKLPEPVGPYSIYREAGDFIFLAGQIGIDPEKGEMPEDTKEQTEIVLRNITNILKSLNLSTKNIVKTTIYLKNMEDFAVVNSVYEKFFEKPYPARTTCGVKELPKNAKVEIEVIAYKKL
jgi:2-iminobutanoate/2-iminopropanoate deaminase